MLPHLYELFPLGLFTFTLLIVMFPHTDGLEHTIDPTNGSYFLLVVPAKLRRVMSEIVKLDGNYVNRMSAERYIHDVQLP